MMIRYAFPLLVGTMLSTHAMALDACTPTTDDQAVRTCVYTPTQRYVVNGIVGFPVDLNFGPDEHIKRIEPAYTGVDQKGDPTQTWHGPGLEAGGDKSGKMPKDRYINNLPIWPDQAGHSFLQVVTRMPDGAERPYLFDLWAKDSVTNCDPDPKAAGCRDDKTTVSALTFKYPADVAAAAKKAADEKHQQAIEAWKAQHAKDIQNAAVARLEVDPYYGPQNKDYAAKGDAKYRFLAPSLVSDNGMLTQMQWPGNIQIPTISIIDPVTHEERAASITSKGRMRIIHGTAEWLRLRLGDAVLDIHNQHWSAEQPNPGTGTTSPDVVRQVLYQRK